MKKLTNIAATILVSSILLVGSAKAQENPASDNSQAPASQPAAQSGDNTAPAKKPAAKSSNSSTTATKTSSAKSSGDKTQSSAATQSSTSTKSSTGTKTPVHHTAAAPLVLNTDKEKRSYAIGMNIGKSMSKNSVDIDPNILARGVKDELAGKTVMTEDDAKAVMTAFQTDMRKKAEEKMQADAAKNKKEGEAFLAANKTKPGVQTLPSGLQYKVLTPGTGPKPTVSDTVECNYKGTLVDGTEFDSSAKHGGAAKFPVSGVIKGWTEALQLMPVGSKWQLYIPPELAYGQRGAGAAIGPDSTLVFEVELVSIVPKAAPPAATPSK